MKKAFLTLLLTAACVSAASAQRRSTVSGVVADADTRQSLIGAVVEMTPVSDSTRATVIVSGAGGAFSTGLGRETHTVKASLLGYEPYVGTAEITAPRQTLDTIYIRQGIIMDAVVKEAVAMRTSVRGDTLIYNADSYKVAADATVSGLLSKMPGIKVDGGTVEAQGETVRKVLIDNREFFGEDVAAAISSLPAEAVKNIEVFDKLSDNAEFTGIDDGEGYRAINITTRESMRQGIMGQVSALYGAEPPEHDGEGWHHYGLAGGNVNIFQGDSRFTVGGTLNNLNERQFTSNDILGVGDDDGIARVGLFRVNYIDQLGKRNQWTVDASYSYDITRSEAYSTIDREYYPSTDALFSEYYSETSRNSSNRGHSLNGRIDWKPNSTHELRIRPFIRFQGNDGRSTSDEIYYPVGNAALPIELNNWSTNDQAGSIMGLSANYRVRLGKPGRTLSMFFNTSYDPDDHRRESYSERQELDANGENIYIRQSTPSFNYDFDIGGGLTYTEPVSDHSLVNLDYSISYNYSDQDRKAYLWDTALGRYDMSAPDVNLSGVYNSGYITHRAGPGYRLQKGKTSLSVGVFYQYSTLESSRRLPREYDLKQDFSNILYSVLLNTQFPNGASIRAFLNSRTRNPSILDLQDIADITNVQNISRGNIDLKPSYGNMFYLRFNMPNVEKGRSLGINMGGNYTNNSIVRRVIRESPGFQILDPDGNVVETLDAVGTYSEPVNMDGQWSARFGVDYGFPIKFLSSNFNIEAGVNYQEAPSQIGKWAEGMPAPVYQTNYLRELNPNVELTLGSNISERVDFRVDYDFGYNRTRNSYFEGADNEDLEHEIDLEFKFVLPAYFTIAGNAEWSYRRSIAGQDFTREYFVANAAVGKKIFRSRQGEISLVVNDIFNQNIGFRRTAAAQYIQNRTNSVIGRYVGLKFTWNIRRFGKNGSTNMDLYNTGGWGGRGGRGPGGPGGGPGGPPPGGGGFGGGRPF
jgi:hypothetical protein